MTTRITKPPAGQSRIPNLLDYEKTCATFRWDDAARLLDGLPGGAGLNIGYEAVDRHLLHGRGARSALRWIGRTGEVADFCMPSLGADMESAKVVDIPEADVPKLFTLRGLTGYLAR